jgi:hypothetical protein
MATRSSGGRSTSATTAAEPAEPVEPPAPVAPAANLAANPAAKPAAKPAANPAAKPAVARVAEAEPVPWSPLTAGEELTAAADLGLRTRPVALLDQLSRARYALVRRLLWVLAGVLVGGVGMLVTTRWTGLTADDVSDFVTMVFGAVVALAGCAVGFCFGGDDRGG